MDKFEKRSARILIEGKIIGAQRRLAEAQKELDDLEFLRDVIKSAEPETHHVLVMLPEGAELERKVKRSE